LGRPTRADGRQHAGEDQQHAGEDLPAKVFLVAEVRAALEDADLVVQALDEPEGDLVVGAAVRRDPVPVPVNHRGELLVGSQALPFEGGWPVLEEAAASNSLGARRPDQLSRYGSVG